MKKTGKRSIPSPHRLPDSDGLYTLREEGETDECYPGCSFIRNILDSSPILICGIDPDGTTRFLNQVGERILGYQSEEMHGRNWWRTLLPGRLYSQLEEMISTFGLGDVTEHELKISTSNGEERTILWSSTYIFTKEGKLTEEIGFGIDITERNALEMLLLSNQEQMNLAHRNARLGNWEWNLASNRFFISDEGLRILGINSISGQMTFDEFLDHVHPCDQQRLKEYSRTSKGIPPTAHLNYQIVMPDGTSRMIHESRSLLYDNHGELVSLIGAFVDVTEQNRIQSMLKASKEELESLVRSRTKELVKANLRLEHEVSSQRKTEKALKEKTLELEELNKTLEERVQREIEGRREKEQILMHQAKLASMGEMINAIAHQWRQPLNNIGLLIQDLLEAYDHGEMSRDYIGNSVNNAMGQLNTLSNTIDDFRKFFKSSEDDSVFRVDKVVQEVISIVSSQLKDSFIHIESSFANVDFDVMGRQNELKQALLNIVMNARDAIAERNGKANCMNNGGNIWIECSGDERKLRILVTDTGGGIPLETIEKVFEPYFTTKEEGKGTGLGLYMAKIIIEQNFKGQLTAKNIEGGSRFSIEIPRIRKGQRKKKPFFV